MSLRRPTVECTAFIFCYKPFMWCRLDARLRHYYSCIFLSRSHSDTRLAPVLLFCSFLSRSHSDTRLAPVLPFLHFPLEESFRPSFGTSTTILQFPLEASFRPSLGTQYLLSLCLIALVNVFICFMFTFVISYVRTVLRVLS